MQSDSYSSQDWESTDSEIESQPGVQQNCNVEASHDSHDWESTNSEIETQPEESQNCDVEISHVSSSWESTSSEVQPQPEDLQNCNVKSRLGSPSWETTDSEIESQSQAPQDYNIRTNQMPSESIVLKPSKAFQVSKDESEQKSKTNAVVIAGTGITQKTFHIELSLLFNSSAILRTLVRDPALSTDFKLPTEDPFIAAMFIDWAKAPEEPITYAPCQYSPEPWRSNAAAAYFLGQRLGAALFSKYALSQFIQNCAIIARSPWRNIEDTAPAESPLARFSNHWAAWNASLCGPGINEYSGLRAARTLQVNPNTRDPRVLDLDHWYASCGDDVDTQCEHDPVYVESVGEELRRMNKTPPPEWGFEHELKANLKTERT